ncbi:MAG: hypothetical protein JF599_04515 [Verrucomicrobia bacterium]|nr:hypothetical protein [Verrucomicrobiota bacterium]
MRWFLRLIIPAGLGLAITGLAVTGSACFTAATISSSKESTESIHWSALRVTRCYLNAGREMVVLAEGGVAANDDFKSLPRKRVTIALKLGKLSEETRPLLDSAWVLPLRTLQKGWPDAAFLAKGGFEEVSFSEDNEAATPAAPTDGRKDASPACVRITYKNRIPTESFPEGLGFAPHFAVADPSGGAPVRFVIADIKTRRHLGRLLLLPLAIPADLILIPVMVVAGATSSL